MRRLLAFATFGLLVLFVQMSSQPVLAQHGGGHASSGGHGGGGFAGGHSSFGGGHGGSFGGQSSFSGHSGFSTSSPSVHAYSGPLSRPGYTPRYAAPMRSYSHAPAFRPPQSSSASRFGSREPLGSWNRFSGRRSHRDRDGDGIRFRTRNFWGPWRYGYPGWYGYYDPYWYDPYWWWDSSSDDQNNGDGQYQDYAQANDGQGYDPGYENEQSLEEQSARENEEQDRYERSQPREPLHAELTAPSPPTTLIFRDEHKQEIQNYAIIGHTLWSFSTTRTEKIPLSDLDIPATQKVNEDKGVNFRVPAAGEGQ